MYDKIHYKKKKVFLLFFFFYMNAKKKQVIDEKCGKYKPSFKGQEANTSTSF